jgi:thiamine pyrophosphate-dependent acetolactate synthase large subunit-like protein
VLYDFIGEDKLVLPLPIPPPPQTFADPKSVRAALDLLKTAKNPLVIVGKVPISQ